MLQYVTVLCCSVSTCAKVVLRRRSRRDAVCCSVLQCVACCVAACQPVRRCPLEDATGVQEKRCRQERSVLQCCVVVCCGVLQRGAVRCTEVLEKSLFA